MSIKANLIIDQGTDFSATIDLMDGFDAPYDLTGFTVSSQMRKNFKSSTAVDFSATSNGVLGQIILSMSKTITTDLDPGRYLYDVEITSAVDVTTRVVEGVVNVTPGITRT